MTEALASSVVEFLNERWAQLVVAILFAGLGALVTAWRNRRKTADRIAWELLETQKAMLDRAFPIDGWKQSDPREA